MGGRFSGLERWSYGAGSGWIRYSFMRREWKGRYGTLSDLLSLFGFNSVKAGASIRGI